MSCILQGKEDLAHEDFLDVLIVGFVNSECQRQVKGWHEQTSKKSYLLYYPVESLIQPEYQCHVAWIHKNF